MTIKFCSNCGSSVTFKIPEGDNRKRHCCENCNEIIYQNPKIVAGCIAHVEKKILLCKRAIEPRKNFWTIPAGFLENGESIENGAIRETLEEAKLKVKELKLFGPSCIQCILSGSRIKFIDANCRFGGGSILSIKADSGILKNLFHIIKNKELVASSEFKENLVMLRNYKEVFLDEASILK